LEFGMVRERESVLYYLRLPLVDSKVVIDKRIRRGRSQDVKKKKE